MNTDSTSEYLLLFRGSDWTLHLSPAELQTIMARFTTWIEGLSADGTLKAGQPLMDDIRVVSSKNGRTVVADGPFAEAKETVGGYFLLRTASLEDAVAIARQCPTLEHGTTVEVRAIAAECSHLQSVRQRLAEELAPATR